MGGYSILVVRIIVTLETIKIIVQTNLLKAVFFFKVKFYWNKITDAVKLFK